MFAVKRISRLKLSLKNHLHTSSVIRCDQPKNPKSEKNKSKAIKKNTTKSSEPTTIIGKANKKKLIAEVNAEDYASFKSQKSRSSERVELYSDSSNKEEKFEAKKALKSLSQKIESEGDLDVPTNDNFQNLSVAKVKKVETKTEDELVKSAKVVASEFKGDVKKTERDILGYLKKLELKAEKSKSKEDADIKNEETEIFKRDFIEDRDEFFRRNRPNFFRDRSEYSMDREEQMMDSEYMNEDNRDYASDRRQFDGLKIGNFISGKRISAKPLGVFIAKDLKDEGPKLKIWDELKEWELKFMAKIPPRNHFEELIQWTEEGKLWRFPIDNDQDNKLEANVDFTEHVFLEKHLEPWCPKKGPLRHFMELVLTGLSKNYHLSVEEKKEHIYWYRDYFEEKKKLLQEMGALDSGKVSQECKELNSKPESSA